MFYTNPRNTFNIKQIENEIKNIDFKNSDFATIGNNSKYRIFCGYFHNILVIL